MKTTFAVFCFLLFSESISAQSQAVAAPQFIVEPQSMQLSSTLTEPVLPSIELDLLPSTPRETRNLPDAPVPKNESRQDGSYTDQFGNVWGKDPLAGSDRSWGRAMGHPYMFSMAGVLAGLTAIQLIKTDRCINENKAACNLIFRKNRVATYAVNIPLTSAIIWYMGRLKERGHGVSAVMLFFGALMYQAPVTYTANPHVLVCQTGRVPQCQ